MVQRFNFSTRHRVNRPDRGKLFNLIPVALAIGNTDNPNLHTSQEIVNTMSEQRLTEDELVILRKAGKIFAKLRMERVSPERRKEISVIAHAKSLEVRQANAARRKAEKEAACPQKP